MALARGFVIGGALGGIILLVDTASGGVLSDARDLLNPTKFARAGFLLEHADKPWLALTARAVAADTVQAQRDKYGNLGVVDGPQDAFRHTLATALLTLRCMRDHGVGRAEAGALALGITSAYEQDTNSGHSERSNLMDIRNNKNGVRLVGNGRAKDGNWISESALIERVLNELSSGKLDVAQALNV